MAEAKTSQYDQEFILGNLHLSNNELGEVLGKSASAIVCVLRNKGITRESDKNHSKYFNVPCYPEYAYILGWLFADGHVSNRLSMNIVREDAQFIESTMMKVYPWKKRSVIYKNQNAKEQIDFLCYKSDVVNFFVDEWGFKRKSYGMDDKFYRYLACANDDCRRCFLRGFFDGDGYVFNDQPFFSIGKRIDFDWTNILKLMPQFTHYKIRKKDPGTGSGRTSSLEIYRDGPLFFQYIYNASFKLALPRKKDRVLAHFEKPYYRDKYGPLMQTD